jgi:hypothetical protein
MTEIITILSPPFFTKATESQIFTRIFLGNRGMKVKCKHLSQKGISPIRMGFWGYRRVIYDLIGGNDGYFGF